MKPLKKLALIPMFALAGFAAAQVAVPAAYGEVNASILFNINEGVSGFVSYGEPFYERIIEPPVVYVYREPPRPVIIHEHARPVVIVKKEYRGYDHPGRGHKYGLYKQQARQVVVIEDHRGHDRYDRGHDRYTRGGDRYERRDVRGGERYIQYKERLVQGNGRTVQYEHRGARGDNHTRGYVKQVVETRKGKHDK